MAWAWADPDYGDGSWPSPMVPRDWRNQGYSDYYGFGWYRIKLQFDLSDTAMRHDRERLGIRLGKIRSAYEIYAGGQLIGGASSLPPKPEIVYDRKANYAIPSTAIDENGRVVIAVRVWREELVCECAAGGHYEGEFPLMT